MLVRYSDWKKPTDEAYAFRLRSLVGSGPGEGGFVPEVPAPGSRSDIREVCRRVLEPGEAERFESSMERWTGPEDVGATAAERPYEGQQLHFEEHRFQAPLTMGHLDAVLRGTACVMQSRSGSTDYVLRDHHMLDVALYHYATRGTLPCTLFHADRHSDWCRPTYLDAKRPQQAATWWALFEGLKRPEDGAPVLRERDVYFTTAQAIREPWMAGRDVGVSTSVPGARDPDALGYGEVLEEPGCVEADWVSLDLDYFQPSPQLALTSGLLRDERFAQLVSRARVRVFVLSPQFLRGGDRLSEWKTCGGLHSSLRLLNLLRRQPRD